MVVTGAVAKNEILYLTFMLQMRRWMVVGAMLGMPGCGKCDFDGNPLFVQMRWMLI